MPQWENMPRTFRPRERLLLGVIGAMAACLIVLIVPFGSAFTDSGTRPRNNFTTTVYTDATCTNGWTPCSSSTGSIGGGQSSGCPTATVAGNVGAGEFVSHSTASFNPTSAHNWYCYSDDKNMAAFDEYSPANRGTASFMVQFLVNWSVSMSITNACGSGWVSASIQFQAFLRASTGVVTPQGTLTFFNDTLNCGLNDQSYSSGTQDDVFTDLPVGPVTVAGATTYAFEVLAYENISAWSDSALGAGPVDSITLDLGSAVGSGNNALTGNGITVSSIYCYECY